MYEKTVMDFFLQGDEEYQAQATPLKSAYQCKEEHRQQIRNALEMTDFRAKMELAWRVIYRELPQLRSEFSHLTEASFKEGEPFQTTFQISDATMLSIYSLGRRLLDLKSYKDAEAVFAFLVYLNPLIPEYLIGEGISFYQLGNYKDALVCLNLSKEMQPDKAISYIYSALCHRKLQDAAENDCKRIEEIFGTSKEEQEKWGSTYLFIKNKEVV